MNTTLSCSKLITETSIIMWFRVFKISFETQISHKLGGEKKKCCLTPRKTKNLRAELSPYFHKQQILVQPLIYKRIFQVRQNI